MPAFFRIRGKIRSEPIGGRVVVVERGEPDSGVRRAHLQERCVIELAPADEHCYFPARRERRIGPRQERSQLVDVERRHLTLHVAPVEQHLGL